MSKRMNQSRYAFPPAHTEPELWPLVDAVTKVDVLEEPEFTFVTGVGFEPLTVDADPEPCEGVVTGVGVGFVIGVGWLLGAVVGTIPWPLIANETLVTQVGAPGGDERSVRSTGTDPLTAMLGVSTWIFKPFGTPPHRVMKLSGIGVFPTWAKMPTYELLLSEIVTSNDSITPPYT
jgi:hypothetical protein